MYTSVYESKFKDFLKVEFQKVPGHSNVIYNEEADRLAKSALVDRKKVAIQGDNWFSIPYFKEDDFNAFVELIEESDEGISHTITSASSRDIYKFKLNRDVATVRRESIEWLHDNYSYVENSILSEEQRQNIKDNIAF